MSLRYTRQVRLAEVGVSGQEKLCRAEIHPGGEGVAGEVEARYLAAAGARVAAATSSAVSEEVRAVLAPFTNDEARDFAEGALRALVAIRDVLRS